MTKTVVRELAPEAQRVIDFRLQWLLTVYSTKNAEKIAEDLSMDWHLAYNIRQQCPDEALCMRVLYGS